MVVRPTSEGSNRSLNDEKKSALMSSDLPRENSARKASMSRPLFRFSSRS